MKLKQSLSLFLPLCPVPLSHCPISQLLNFACVRCCCCYRFDRNLDSNPAVLRYNLRFQRFFSDKRKCSIHTKAFPDGKFHDKFVQRPPHTFNALSIQIVKLMVLKWMQNSPKNRLHFCIA